ncbi:hypothetical protein MPER_12677, partial [Moniliophthora perniciosa FA553]
MASFAPASAPPTKLGIYRVLSPRAGVHLSPLALGAASIGDKWGDWMGHMGKEASFKLLDAYYDMKGNFIDTANAYQEESSEEFIGEWAEKRGIRDQLFIATKHRSELEKARTSYIDLLYVHWWDWDTSIEEVMDGLHNLVVQGKVLYLGISDAPAWVVAKANQYAKDHGKTPFVVYQGEWNIIQRSFERDIIPMARDFGMALAPFGVLAGGKLRTDAEEKKRLESGENGRLLFSTEWMRNETQVKASRALEKIASEVGAKSIAS